MFATKKIVHFMCCRTLSVRTHSWLRIPCLSDKHLLTNVRYIQVRKKRHNSFDSLFKSSSEESVQKSSSVRSSPKKSSVRDLNTVLTEFIRKPEVRNLATERGLTARQLRLAFVRFRTVCLNKIDLPVELEIVLNDILAGAAHPDELFRQFMNFAMKMFPHLQCREELSKICDLRDPCSWYPLARSMGRKIIFHAGPTNSGKTYHALNKFVDAKKGLYCGPLKMLATEVYLKTRDKGFDCDLVTGDERQYSRPDGQPSDRMSCTVEMTPLEEEYDVAIIDEVQMLQDNQRGWAWSRALLGVAAREVHICGEAAAIPLVKSLLATAGETVEVRQYKRLTGLQIETSALKTMANVRPGDCLVCFSKKDLYRVTNTLEGLGHRVAVIYGSLPPGAKLLQCKKFNDESDPCSIMVATDAIGMGLNLNIRRIVFMSLKKIETSNGRSSMEQISVSQALQIAGRAGRFKTQYEEGHVTTFHERDLKTLKGMLSSSPPPAEKAGLYPTAEQIEMVAYHLPDSSLLSILEIFTDFCQMDDSLYFMCSIESFRHLAEKIDNIQLPLRVRYIFCCAPVNIRDAKVVMMLIRMAREYRNNRVMTADWLAKMVNWPPPVPQTIVDLSSLESLHDVFELYQWLSLRFSDMFPETDSVRDMKRTLDYIIVQGLAQLTSLVSKHESSSSVVKRDESDDSINSSADLDSDEDTNFEQSGDTSEQTGSLAQDLVKSGAISSEVLDRLKYEWKQEFARRKDGERDTQKDP